jgi:hypothetical protein
VVAFPDETMASDVKGEMQQWPSFLELWKALTVENRE